MLVQKTRGHADLNVGGLVHVDIVGERWPNGNRQLRAELTSGGRRRYAAGLALIAANHADTG